MVDESLAAVGKRLAGYHREELHAQRVAAVAFELGASANVRMPRLESTSRRVSSLKRSPELLQRHW